VFSYGVEANKGYYEIGRKKPHFFIFKKSVKNDLIYYSQSKGRGQYEL